MQALFGHAWGMQKVSSTAISAILIFFTACISV